MSSVVEQIIHTAAKLALSGTAPSTAIVKTKLGGKVPMPMLIEGMARYKALSAEEVAQAAQQPHPAPKVMAEQKQHQDALEQQLATLQQAYAALEARVTALEAKLDGQA